MLYVLDTNTVSFLMRGDLSVSQALISHPRTDVLLPQPVIAEIEYGLARMVHSRRKDRLRERFDVLRGEVQRVLWDDDVSMAFGEIKWDLERRGARIEDLDVAVAAHALAREATLVTDNVEHLGRIARLRIENWRLPEPK